MTDNMIDTMTQRINAKTLAALPTSVSSPKYRPDNHAVGIVHIGIGAFHRGHQAVFTDEAIANSGGDWRIVGVSLRSPTVSQQLNPQDGLYTVIERSSECFNARVVGAVKKVICAKQQPDALAKYLANPAIKIITLTVTEKGYHFSQSNASVDWQSQDIQHDLAHPNTPVSMPGYLVLACQQRMQSEHSEQSQLSIISCDNLPENGRIIESVVLALASKVSSELVTWIQKNVTFCSSMVDRIVPSVSDQDIQEQAVKLGYLDHGLIITEPFKQWVIEDNFCTPRPDWESAGVMLVNNVSDYEKLKLRTLNGSHSALAYMGVLLGHKWIHEAIADPLLYSVIKCLMEDETGPTIPEFEGFDLAAYQQQIVKRFENSEIAYATQQVAMDGSQKLQQRILAPMLELYDQGKIAQTTCLMATLVCWLRYLRQQNESGDTYMVSDPLAELLTAMVTEHEQDTDRLIDTLLGQTSIVPLGLKSNIEFKQNLKTQLNLLKALGTKAYLRQLHDEAL